MKATEYLQGMADVIDRYDALLLDQWGVLHDGGQPYPGAIDCLARLGAAGKIVVILSNSGRSGEENARFIVRMGIDRGLFGEVVSAGVPIPRAAPPCSRRRARCRTTWCRRFAGRPDIFRDPCLEPLGHQAEDAPIANPMSQETDPPIRADRAQAVPHLAFAASAKAAIWSDLW